MPYAFRSCNLEMDFEAYIRFLLRHHAELHLPYAFSTKLSFIASPLIFGKGLLIYSEEPYEIVGAAGFVYGTGANQYEDTHICQVETAFIQKQLRGTPLFVRALQALVQLIAADNPKVERLQFWAGDHEPHLAKLFAKLLALPGSTRTVVNNLALHSVSFDELTAYCKRLNPI